MKSLEKYFAAHFRLDWTQCGRPSNSSPVFKEIRDEVRKLLQRVFPGVNVEHCNIVSLLAHAEKSNARFVPQCQPLASLRQMMQDRQVPLVLPDGSVAIIAVSFTHPQTPTKYYPRPERQLRDEVRKHLVSKGYSHEASRQQAAENDLVHLLLNKYRFAIPLISNVIFTGQDALTGTFDWNGAAWGFRELGRLR